MKNSKRPKGEGSITKLPNGKLKMTLTLGVGADGKQKRKSVTAATKAELMKKVTELRVAIGQPRDTKMYMKDLMDIYLNYKNEELRTNTKLNYDYVIKKVVEPLYDFRVDKVTPEMIDSVLDKARKENGECLSPQTIKTPSAHRTIFIQPDILNLVLETVPKSGKTTKL